MCRVGLASPLVAATAGLPLVSFAQDTRPDPCRPGRINDPSTYRGSTANQALEQQAYRQQEVANQQMQQRLDQTNFAYAPKCGAAGASLKSKPLLPAARNALIGRWRQAATKEVNLGMLGALPGALPGAGSVVNCGFAERCQSIFGKGMVAITPTQLNWVAPDDHEEILNHVEYRSDGANVSVVPTDPRNRS
jgi:hypothetical protein